MASAGRQNGAAWRGRVRGGGRRRDNIFKETLVGTNNVTVNLQTKLGREFSPVELTGLQ